MNRLFRVSRQKMPRNRAVGHRRVKNLRGVEALNRQSITRGRSLE
jgi:hypothetical protein